MRVGIIISLLFTFNVLVFSLVLQKINSSFIKQDKLYHFTTNLQHKMLSALQPPPPPVLSDSTYPKNSGRVFYPIGYGGDPRGAQDSSDAILEALGDAVKKLENGGELLPGISNLGGAVIDLQGGIYKISHPIRLPSGAGNLLIQGGTFRASDAFPGDRHLIELWAPTSQKNTTTLHPDAVLDEKDQNAVIHYEDITFRDILFDSNYLGGGLLIIDSARIRITNCFFIHFTTEGILVQRGHETFVSTSFLGQISTVGGDNGERNFAGTAIDLASNDNAVTDVVIFSAATGIILRGQANMVTGVHCYNKATYFGGVGILVKAAQTRIDNCYLDYNSIVIEDPSQVHVTNGFFLGGGNIVIKSNNGRISGLNIVNNMFSGDVNHMVPIVSLEGGFRDIDQVVVDQNNVNGMGFRSTVGRMAVAGNGTQWVADFSPVLVFPNKISHFQYSFYVQASAESTFPAHFVTNVSNNVVVVESDIVVDGVVSFVVDQYNIPGERNTFM